MTSKKIFATLTILAVLGLLSSFILAAFETIILKEAQAQSAKLIARGKELNYVPGELIIKFKEEIDIRQAHWWEKWRGAPEVTTRFNSINQLNKRFGISNFRSIFGQSNAKLPESLRNVFKFGVSPKENILEVAAAYKKNPYVEYAEPNYLAEIYFTPNDPLYPEQWAHQNTQAEPGWDIERGSPSTTIAIIDTGVDYLHEDLASNIWLNEDEIPENGLDDDKNGFVDDIVGYDFVNVGEGLCDFKEDCTQPDNDPSDYHGHGTHCAGIAAAVANNNKGIAGVCHNCKIMPVRAGYAGGGGGYLEYEDIVEAIYYATDNRADIISMSFGGYDPSDLLKDALDYAYGRDVVLIAAAGNGSTDVWPYPAGYKNVIAVAASNREDKRAEFSNYGYWIDVASPGVDILSTIPKVGVYGNPSGYRRISGTSMAAPYLAGLAGLVISKDSQDFKWDNEQIRQIIRQGVDIPAINIPDSDKYIGTGRTNIYKALQIETLSTAEAEITFPKNDDVITGVIEIRGIARGEYFDSYKLYYGKGLYPDSWSEICNSANPVEVKGILCPYFDTVLLKAGYNNLRLVVTDTRGRETEDRVLVKIERFEISYPLNNDIFRLGDVIEIKGTVAAVGRYLSYTLEYGLGRNPSNWFNKGIELATSTPIGIIEDVLGKWDTSLVPKSGLYTLRLTVNCLTGQKYDFVRICLNSFFKECPGSKNGLGVIPRE